MITTPVKSPGSKRTKKKNSPDSNGSPEKPKRSRTRKDGNAQATTTQKSSVSYGFSFRVKTSDIENKYRGDLSITNGSGHEYALLVRMEASALEFIEEAKKFMSKNPCTINSTRTDISIRCNKGTVVSLGVSQVPVKDCTPVVMLAGDTVHIALVHPIPMKGIGYNYCRWDITKYFMEDKRYADTMDNLKRNDKA